MSFPIVLRSLRLRDALRERARAAMGAAGVMLAAALGVGAILMDREAALLDLSPGTIVVLLAVTLSVAALVYSSRLEACRSARQNAEQQERMTAVVEGTGVGLWESEIGKDRIFVSDRWAQMLGLVRDCREPMHVDAWRELVHPEDLPNVDEVIKQSFMNRNFVFQLDFRLRHADGSWVWVVSRGTVTERAADGMALRVVGTQIEVTAQKMAELALEESEARFRSLFERAPVGIMLTDFSTRHILRVNDAFVEPTGYTREELLQMTYEQLAERADGGPLDQPTAQRERDLRRKDGRRFPVLISGIRMRDPDGREVIWSVVQDISQRKAVEQELAAAARRDRLTGLANRTMFLERLQVSVLRVRGGAQKLFAVLFLDFDRFKVVNDAMGHQAGDHLLVQIADRLRNALRSSDAQLHSDSRNLIARFGGDEFLVLINDISKPEDAARIADRLLQVLSEPYNIQGREVHSTASIGIVTSDRCADDAEAVIRNADVAMYEAKHAGRARWVGFNEDMHSRLSRRLLIETSLRKAIGTDQIKLVYQPIIELETGRRKSVEALIRWKHPTLGSVSPSEFVAVAEESGLIVKMGEWVLHESCAALARWQKLDPEKAPRLISVNVSRAELSNGARLLQTMRSALDAAGLAPECLQLEVTEREVMRDAQASMALMRQLRESGVRLAMDDFGTGTSSLGCLRDYPFDVIKIDRSFITDLSASPDTIAVIHATITLVKNLGKCSVAEGVETAEQLAMLQAMGCQFAQGYFLGYPMDEVDVMASARTVVTPCLLQA